MSQWRVLEKNAWFDKQVTLKWINEVLWPYHKKKHGNKRALLILDNCTAHKDLEEVGSIPSQLTINFLPPNCTSFLQPRDMWMISVLKMRYKSLMLSKLLSICDDEEQYLMAMERKARTRRGCHGLLYCMKANVLDAMGMLNEVWNENEHDDRNRVTEECIVRCWRKSGILPATWNCNINNEVGTRLCRDGKEKIDQRRNK